MKPSEHSQAADLAQLLAERDAARLAAEEAERHRDELLARVGHDLRGPLNSISGWVQLLQSGRLDPGRHRHALEAIARGIRAQTELLDEMQRVSRALRRRLVLDISVVELATPVQRAIDAVLAAAREKSVAVNTAIEPDIAVNGDVEQLTDLVRRLIDNAVRYTPPHRRIDIRMGARGRCAFVAVRDSGVGIAHEDLAAIFNPFRTSADRTATKRTGLGAGLALARHVAELHGGRIEAHSDGPGHGAEFVVTLPLARLADPSPRDSSPAAAHPKRSARPADLKRGASTASRAD